MKHLSVLPLLGSLLLVGCAVGTDNGAWQLSEQQGSRQQVSFNQEQVYCCSYPNGTYQLTYTTVSGDCGDVPIPLPKFMSGKDNLLALGEAVEIVNGGCYLQDHAATNDPSQCTANIDTVCLGGYANGHKPYDARFRFVQAAPGMSIDTETVKRMAERCAFGTTKGVAL